MADEPGAGDSSRVTSFQLYKAVTDLDRAMDARYQDLQRDNEARYSELRGEIRSLQQSVAGENGLAPRMVDHEERIRDVEAWKKALPPSLILFMVTAGIAVVGLFLRS